MLRQLRTDRGTPRMRVRVMALMLVVGLALLSAPILIPVLRALFDALWGW